MTGRRDELTDGVQGQGCRASCSYKLSFPVNHRRLSFIKPRDNQGTPYIVINTCTRSELIRQRSPSTTELRPALKPPLETFANKSLACAKAGILLTTMHQPQRRPEHKVQEQYNHLGFHISFQSTSFHEIPNNLGFHWESLTQKLLHITRGMLP